MMFCNDVRLEHDKKKCNIDGRLLAMKYDKHTLMKWSNLIDSASDDFKKLFFKG